MCVHMCTTNLHVSVFQYVFSCLHFYFWDLQWIHNSIYLQQYCLMGSFDSIYNTPPHVSFLYRVSLMYCTIFRLGLSIDTCMYICIYKRYDIGV